MDQSNYTPISFSPPPSSSTNKMVILIVIIIALFLVSVISYVLGSKSEKDKAFSQYPSPTSTIIALTTPVKIAQPVATSTVIPTSTVELKTYISKQESSLSFQYPVNLVTKDVGASDPNGDGIQITLPNGTLLWYQSSVNGIGGSCDGIPTHAVINEVWSLANAPDFFAVDYTMANVEHIGVVGLDKNRNPPKTGDVGSCMYYTLFNSKSDPKRLMWFEVNGPLKSEDKTIAEQILQSLKY